MEQQAGSRKNAEKKGFLAPAAREIIAFALLLLPAAPLSAQSAAGQAPATQTLTPSSAAQPSTPQWQIDAGGKKAFDVASVKQDTADPSAQTVNSNMPLGPGDYYSPTGGLFTATNLPAFVYIAFAYKLTGNQIPALLPQLPKWVTSDRFDIQARVEGNPTKDQMRLMMQALLADRFKMAVHSETRQLPVFGLALDKPGKMGPQMQAHPKDSACSTVSPSQPAPGSAPAAPETVAGGFPVNCGGIQGMQASTPGRVRAGARNVTMELIAGTLSGMGNLDRPVLDRTGLSGTFDFSIEFTPQLNGPLPPGATFEPDPTGPTFLEALKEQLGLKLDSTTGPVDVFVLDHIEEPSPN